MSTDESDSDRNEVSRSRRAVIASLSAAGVALAGCSTDSSNPDSGSDDDGEGDPDTTGDPAGNGGGMTGGCPNPPYSYTTRSLDGREGMPPYTVDTPDFAETEIAQDAIVSFSFPEDDGATSVNVSSSGEDNSVDEAVASRQGFTETTDQYELAVSGARTLTIEPGEVGTTLVFLPADAGTTVVQIDFRIAGRYDCDGTVQTVHRQMVQSVRGPQ